MTTKAAPRPVPAKTNPHHALGRRGEELAARYLESHGLVVLSRNWRCRDGELDLVLTDGSQVVVCEVKTRTDTSFGTPAEAVNEQKSKRIRRLAHKWLSTYRIPWCELRFDILSIIWPPQGPPIVQHIKGAF